VGLDDDVKLLCAVRCLQIANSSLDSNADISPCFAQKKGPSLN
jgi:hypothetical protein